MKTTNPEILKKEEDRDSKLKLVESLICNKDGHNRNKSNTIYRPSRYCSTCHKHISLW